MFESCITKEKLSHFTEIVRCCVKVQVGVTPGSPSVVVSSKTAKSSVGF